jgi:hypothetical protein
MRRLFSGLTLAFALAVPTFAQVGKGLSGAHWNLNIIGVPKDKTVPTMTDSNRHVIFVPLQSGADVTRQVKIYYIRGEDFRVLEGNATNDNEATVQVPYEFCPDLDTGCEELLSFDVYAVGLGQPHRSAIVTAECTYSLDVVGSATTCEETLKMGSFSVDRVKGNPKPVNITDVFRATGCLDVDGSGSCNTGDLQFSNLWIFNIPELQEYMWDYDNNGLKLMQIRFYETTSGSISTVK